MLPEDIDETKAWVTDEARRERIKQILRSVQMFLDYPGINGLLSLKTCQLLQDGVKRAEKDLAGVAVIDVETNELPPVS